MVIIKLPFIDPTMKNCGNSAKHSLILLNRAREENKFNDLSMYIPYYMENTYEYRLGSCGQCRCTLFSDLYLQIPSAQNGNEVLAFSHKIVQFSRIVVYVNIFS